jgi:homeodomain-containing protein
VVPWRERGAEATGGRSKPGKPDPEKKPVLGLLDPKRCGRMKPERKREVIELVRRSPLAKKETLAELGQSVSTYSRWQRRYREQGEVGLLDRRPQPGTIWNRLRPEEEQAILQAALREPDRSPREIGC